MLSAWLQVVIGTIMVKTLFKIRQMNYMKGPKALNAWTPRPRKKKKKKNVFRMPSAAVVTVI